MSTKNVNKILKVLLILLAVLVIAGLYFADKRLSAVAKNTADLKAQVEIDTKKLESYELTKIKIEELGYIKDIAKEILPNTENQSVIVAELAEFGRRSNLQTGSITFAEAAKTTPKDKTANKVPEGVAVVPVVFTVSETAQYQDLLDFLKYIEQNRRKMQITQISLTPNPDNGEQLQDISVSLNLFVKKAPEEKKED